VTSTDPQFLNVGDASSHTGASRRLAYRLRQGSGPAIVWLGGFRSDMGSTKALALDQWGASHGRAVLRFDYSGHGESGGRFEDATISQWLADSLAVIDALAPESADPGRLVHGRLVSPCSWRAPWRPECRPGRWPAWCSSRPRSTSRKS
jgi:pimeloyl-ACP methyl ester carboxylesterase